MTPTDMAKLPPLPPVIDRPKWAFFLWSRNIGLEDAAEVLDRSHEYVRQLGLPWDHKKRKDPTEDEVVFIAAWSRGEVGAADWLPPAKLESAA